MPDVEDKIKIVCPKCSTKQYVSVDKAFSKHSCESCEVRFTVPKIFGTIMLHDLVSNDEFSSTHTGTHLKNGHLCRVRVFNDKLYNDEEATKFLKEQIFRLQKANLEGSLKVLSYGFVGKEFYIELDHDDKGSLKSRIMNEKVSQKAALEFSISIGESLLEAHQKNIVCGNLKTSNIRCMKNRQIKLADCGITWSAASILSEKNSSIESFNNLPYIAPETITNRVVNKASDIYSYGCVVYEMISKVAPFEEYSSREAIMNAHKEKTPMDLQKRKPALPADVSKMVMRMLKKDSQERPSDIKDIIECFKTNLTHVDEFKVEEIKREFDSPSPDQTLKPRPPTEIDLNLLAGGDPTDSASSSNASVNTGSSAGTKEKLKEATPELKSDLDKMLDGETLDINDEVKLQDTEVNMDFNDIGGQDIGKKGSKATLYVILGVVLIVILCLAYMFIAGPESSGSERKPLVPQGNTAPQ